MARLTRAAGNPLFPFLGKHHPVIDTFALNSIKDLEIAIVFPETTTSTVPDSLRIMRANHCISTVCVEITPPVE